MDEAAPSAAREMGRALGAERGEALGGVVGGEQLGHGLALEVDGVGEREERAALHEVFGGAVRERRTGGELPGEPLGDHERRVGTAQLVDQAEPVGVDRAEALAAWHARHQLVEGDAHVHGANLGIRADRWRAVGRFGRRTVGEDVDLVERVRAVTDRWVATDTTRVLTSGRSHSRVEHGFADYLHDLDAETG